MHRQVSICNTRTESSSGHKQNVADGLHIFSLHKVSYLRTVKPCKILEFCIVCSSNVEVTDYISKQYIVSDRLLILLPTLCTNGANIIHCTWHHINTSKDPHIKCHKTQFLIILLMSKENNTWLTCKCKHCLLCVKKKRQGPVTDSSDCHYKGFLSQTHFAPNASF